MDIARCRRTGTPAAVYANRADDSSVVEQRTPENRRAEAVKRAETRWSQVRYLPAAPPPLPATYTRAVGEILSFELWMEKEGYRPAIQPRK